MSSGLWECYYEGIMRYVHNSTELNKEIPMHKYKFTKRGGKLILIAKKEDTVNDKCINIINEVMNDETDSVPLPKASFIQNFSQFFRF